MDYSFAACLQPSILLFIYGRALFVSSSPSPTPVCALQIANRPDGNQAKTSSCSIPIAVLLRSPSMDADFSRDYTSQGGNDDFLASVPFAWRDGVLVDHACGLKTHVTVDSLDDVLFRLGGMNANVRTNTFANDIRRT